MPKNGKLLRRTVQNETLEIAASLLIKKWKADLHDEPDTYYAITTDECKEEEGYTWYWRKCFPTLYLCVVTHIDLTLSCAEQLKCLLAFQRFFCIINSLHNFMTGAHRRATFLEIQRQMRPGQKTLELERSCDVSWSSWSNAVSKVFTLLGPMLETLATFSKSSGQTKLEADSLLRQMQTNFFLFLPFTFNQLFEVSGYATKGLQSSTQLQLQTVLIWLKG